VHAKREMTVSDKAIRKKLKHDNEPGHAHEPTFPPFVGNRMEMIPSDVKSFWMNLNFPGNPTAF
jgi:hypothetical protein